MRTHKKLVCLRRSLFLGVLSVLLYAVAGCGGGKAKVSGKVTLDGKPLGTGRIVFFPSQGNGIGAEIKDGQYSVDRVPVGDVKVTVETKAIEEKIQALSQSARNVGMMQPKGNVKMPEKAKERLAEANKANERAAQELKDLKAAFRKVPDKYGKAETSGLSTKIKSGSNTFDVDLSSK